MQHHARPQQYRPYVADPRNYNYVEPKWYGGFHYRQLQTANFLPTQEPHRFSLLAYGQYLELSLNGYVILTLADDQFTRGRIGFYAEGAKIRVENPVLNTYTTPTSADFPETLARL
jgi:beta-fructofuranosidase